MSILLLLPVLVPVLAGLAMLIPQLNTPAMRRSMVLIVLMATVLLLLPVNLLGEMTLPLFTLSDDLPIFLHADLAGKLFAMLMAFVWAMAGFYALDYMAHEGGERRFFSLYLITLGMLMGLCFSGSLLTFYMFFEGMTLLTMPLVMHSGRREAVAAGVKYLIYSILGASMVLLGAFVLYPFVTTLEFAPGGVLDAAKVAGNEGTVYAFAFVMLMGFSVKAGMFPLHGWLPTAHPEAPSPASAVLSGVITKAGVLGVIRLLFHFFGADFLRSSWVHTAYMALALFTVFSGSLLAYRTRHLKRRLAYSTVSQVSYILFGLSTLHPLGLVGALLHAVCHSLVKNTLFLSAGAIIMKTGKTQVEELAGVGRRMPVTMACFTAASLGLIGIPPCLGFISKWYLAQGSLAAVGVPAFMTVLGPVVLLMSALLTAGYLMPIVARGFFAGHDAPAVSADDASWQMLLPLVVLAALSVLLGLFPQPLTQLFTLIAGPLM